VNDDSELERQAQIGIERFVAEVGDPFRVTHTLQVTSFGGAGTTAVIAYLIAAGVELQPGPAQWPFKHRRTPPTREEVPDGFRAIYVVGDPRNAVMSIFRRGIQFGHFGALRDRNPSPAEAAELSSLESYLAGTDDPFLLADHAERWMSRPLGYPLLVVRQESLHLQWERICDFVGIDDNNPPPPVRHRSSDWQELPEPVRQALDRQLGPLASWIDERAPKT
jgi:hypothetical protein